MIKKRVIVFSIFSLLIINLFMSFVSAGIVEDTEKVINNVLDVLSPLTKFLIGDAGGDSALFFAKFLLLILVVSILYVPVKSFPGIGNNKLLVFIISLIVGLLGIRFLTNDIISTITLPYSTFAIAVTTLLPLILYFVWVERGLVGKPTLRKIAWIFAAVIFIGLSISRYDDIGNLTEGFNPVWFYMIASGLCVVFLFADHTIQRAWTKAQLNEVEELKKIEIRAELLEEYDKTVERFNKERLSKAAANSIIGRIRSRARAQGLDQSIFDLLR